VKDEEEEEEEEARCQKKAAVKIIELAIASELLALVCMCACVFFDDLMYIQSFL